MTFKLARVVGVALLLLNICGQLNAAPAEALRPPEKSVSVDERLDEYIHLAKKYYQNNDFINAKREFEQALNIALQQIDAVSQSKIAMLRYNLGSVCYRLKQYDQSRAYFQQLQEHKDLGAIAYYNIALIENKQGDKEASIDAFRKSRSMTEDDQLTELIDKQLQKLTVHKPVPRKKIRYKDWHAYLYLSPGYDSNISFAPLEIASDESGYFLQFIGMFDKVIAGKGSGSKRPALLLTSMVYANNYFSTDFNDYNIVDVGLRYAFPLGRWKNKIDLNLKQSNYGHRQYQHIAAATFRTKYRAANNDVFRLRYRYEQIASRDAIFDYLDGYRQRFRLGYQFIWPEDALHLWYELEWNDRTNTVNRNYSPTRNTFRVRYEKNLNSRNKVFAELEYRHSEYEPTATQDRQDDRSAYLLAYVYDIAPTWQSSVKWRYRTNRSTDSIYSYDRHVGMVTLRKLF